MRMHKVAIGVAWATVMAGVLIGCGSVPAKEVDAGVVDGAPMGCTANAFTCGADDALYQCDADGAVLTKVQDCQYGCSVDSCNECEPNTTFCSSDDLVQCDSNGKIVNPQACGFGCQMDRCNTCEPGSKYCDGSNAVTCGANGEPAATMNCGAPGCNSGVCNTCTPNTTTCQGDSLVICNANGTVQNATTCALGCETTPTAHCKTLEPSYGVPAPSGNLPALVVDADSTLTINDCVGVSLVKPTSSTVVPASQLEIITQTGGPPICVIKYGTITIASGFTLTIVNSASTGHVVSLQSVGDLDIRGTIAFVNAHVGPSPGGNTSAHGVNANGDHRAPGGGGGGAAYAGGNGGAYDPDSSQLDYAGGTGGAAVTTIATRLTGGSSGGNVTDGGSTLLGIGGRGGGGLQLVSLTRVAISATGRIDLNGRGGAGTVTGMLLSNPNLPAGGGGSGGSLVVEAPVVTISAGGIAAANGGGGGGSCYTCPRVGFNCFTHNGQPGQLSAARAAGGSCTQPATYGNGGYESDGGTGSDGLPSNQGAVNHSGGGGGGSRGFIILRGRSTSSVTIANGAIVSPMPTLGAVKAN